MRGVREGTAWVDGRRAPEARRHVERCCLFGAGPGTRAERSASHIGGGKVEVFFPENYERKNGMCMTFPKPVTNVADASRPVLLHLHTDVNHAP